MDRSTRLQLLDIKLLQGNIGLRLPAGDAAKRAITNMEVRWPHQGG
jgi:hypothetical protein